MKITSGLILAAWLAAPVLAQTPPAPTAPGSFVTTPAPVPPPPMPPVQAEVTAPTNQPPAKAKSAAKKKPAAPAKKPAATKKPTPAAPPANPAGELVVNEPAVAKQNNVNVRGKATMNSEVVAHLKTGETVTVLDLVKVPHGEPPLWAKIALPASSHSWVNTSFIDANKAVKPAKLNVRSGPGENYSVIGLMHKGDAIKVVTTKGDWTEIEAAPGAFAFVAAHLLAHKAPAAPPAANIVASTPPPATPETVNVPPTIVQLQPGGAPPSAPAVPLVTPTLPPMAPAVDDTPPPPRIVQREGVVGGAVSIQAPSHYQLESLENGKVMDYLYTTSTNLVMSRYFGLTVLVTGEEGLDERWPNIPVITIQKIQQVETPPGAPAPTPVAPLHKAGKGM